MKLVVFGLTVSSSWGNGHATLWRGLVRALAARGVRVVFFERDQPFYARHRDLHDLSQLGAGAELVLYRDWDEAAPRALRELRDADAGLVTSYQPDAQAAGDLLLASRAQAVFYDMDTPVTLARLAEGDRPEYLPAEGLGGFDLVLSYTGGRALEALSARLGARRCAPLYGHADPAAHRPARPDPRFMGDLSYIGTYAADRQAGVEALFVEPARRRSDLKFVLAGSGYPADFPWTANTFFVRHLPPPEHAAFYSSSRLTLNVTRADMAAMGWCPSGRMFEAALCGAPLLSDAWEGLSDFFTPGEEVLLADGADAAAAALDLSPDALAKVAEAARAKVLSRHTSAHRADELLALLEAAPALQPALT